MWVSDKTFNGRWVYGLPYLSKKVYAQTCFEILTSLVLFLQGVPVSKLILETDHVSPLELF